MEDLDLNINKMEEVIEDTFHHMKTVDLFNIKPHPKPYGRGSKNKDPEINTGGPKEYINPPKYERVSKTERWFIKKYYPKEYERHLRPKRGKK